MDILNREMKILVALITEKIRNREDKKKYWKTLKKEKSRELGIILDLPEGADVSPGELIGFDIDPDSKLILLNYTSQAHNILHEIPGGWTEPMRMMRGLVYSYETPGDISGVKLVSRGFEKFFNQSELEETSIDNLRKISGDKKLKCVEKADGHMIQYFMDGHFLSATTRGKFGTPSSTEALRLMNRAQWIKAEVIAKSLGVELMTLVTELVTPSTEVHVDYDGAETLYLLAAFDTDGNKIHDSILSDIVGAMPETFKMPEYVSMTLDEILDDISDRNIVNKEGWVVDFFGKLVKFKYETYIGRMVASKLSYKYIMRCLQNDRHEKMMSTLPEEIREVSNIMTEEVMDKVKECMVAGTYTPLYDLHSQLDGGRDYFRTVCREFYREYIENIF